jgi:hypothetical protein
MSSPTYSQDQAETRCETDPPQVQIIETPTCLQQFYKSLVKRITQNRSSSIPYGSIPTSGTTPSIEVFPIIQRVHNISFAVPPEVAYVDRLAKGHRRWILAQRQIESHSRAIFTLALSPPDDLPSNPVLATRLETEEWQRRAFQYLLNDQVRFLS